jgi:hypothetical protein
LLNQADAHFAGWLMCPVCKKETRHYTKDTHESRVSKMRRIGSEVWFRYSLNKQTVNWNKLRLILNRKSAQNLRKRRVRQVHLSCDCKA